MGEGSWSVPLADVQADEELLDAAREAVTSGWWSMGPRVAALEEAFATAVGARHAIAVSSGTAAIHLALVGLGCGPGDEVVVPSLTFVAAANMVAATGARPVFCDVVGAEDLNLDPDDVESAVTERTRAIMVLHYGGFPCDMDAVLALARRRGLAVIEDAAHAPRSFDRGRACGAIGDVGCFSFFSNKNLPVGEGGMVVTDDEDVASAARLARSHGMTRLTWDRHRGHAATYDVVMHGFNYRLDEIRAAMALVQLGRLDARNEARRHRAERYRATLDQVEDITMPFATHRCWATSAHHLSVAVLPDGTDRDGVRSALAERGVQTSVHYPPIHRFSVFDDLASRPLPQTELVADRILTLPLFPELRMDQVDTVTEALLEAVRARAGKPV